MNTDFEKDFFMLINTYMFGKTGKCYEAPRHQTFVY